MEPPTPSKDSSEHLIVIEELRCRVRLRLLTNTAERAPPQHTASVNSPQAPLSRALPWRPPRLRINDDWTQSI